MRLRHLIFLMIFICIIAAVPAICQTTAPDLPAPTTVQTTTAPVAAIPAVEPGDRIRLALPQLGTEATAVRIGPDYRLDAGDTLAIYVTGKSKLSYNANPAAIGRPGSNPDEVTVALSGEITIPLAGTIKASGLTIAELRKIISESLARYIRNAQIAVTLSAPRTVRVWVNGTVDNPGPQYVTATTTIAEALLRAGIQPNGSTRLITLKRGGVTRTIDLFRIVAVGDLEQNVLLEADDSIVVPPVTQWMEIHGEVVRPGRYELVSLDGKRYALRVSDLVRLAMGTTPSAASNHAALMRPVASGDSRTIHFDATQASETSDTDKNPRILSGDKINVPSISSYQPMIRLVGEFRGNGVYQRVVGSGEAEIRNKTGIYLLAKGQTAGDVIRETGGVTPQADLRKARVERIVDGKTQVVPLDLDRVLMRKDSSADVALENGDTLVLPGLNDLVSVFGEVGRPGAYSYIPNRRLVDYLADAGGPTHRAKQGSIRIVRGDAAKPTVIQVDAAKAAKDAGSNNPILEPGDIIYVPQRIVADWRDIAQIISTIRLLALF